MAVKWHKIQDDGEGCERNFVLIHVGQPLLLPQDLEAQGSSFSLKTLKMGHISLSCFSFGLDQPWSSDPAGQAGIGNQGKDEGGKICPKGL